MANQAAVFIRGKLNGVDFYRKGDRYFAKPSARTVRQTAGTRLCSNKMAIASALGGRLRKALYPGIPFLIDRNAQCRFAGALFKWLLLYKDTELPAGENLPFINGFCFNKATSVKERWRLPLTVTCPGPGLLNLHIPAFVPAVSLSAPAHTFKVTCSIAAACAPVTGNSNAAHFGFHFDFLYNNEPLAARDIPITLPVETGTLSVTVITLCCLDDSGRQVKNQAFIPCSVVDARYI